MTIQIHSPPPSKIHNTLLTTLLRTIPPLSVSADTLTVTAKNIEKAGEIHVAIYENAEAFEADRY